MHKTWDAFFLCINFKRWYKIVRKCDTIEIGKIDYNFIVNQVGYEYQSSVMWNCTTIDRILLYYPKKNCRHLQSVLLCGFIFITLCCVILDVVSIVVIENAGTSRSICKIYMLKSYLISLVATALCSIIYIGVDIVFYKNSFRRAEGVWNSGACYQYM